MATHPHRDMHESVHRFAATKRAARTAKTYGAIAEAFLLFLSERPPERRYVEQFLALPLKSGARASVSTYNQALAAVRSFAKFAVKEGSWQSDPTSELTFERAEAKEPAVLFVPEVVRFIRAAREVSLAGEQARDLALLAVFFTVGLRVSELVQLNVSQLELEAGRLLSVRRKGQRVQHLRLEPRTSHLLRLWLDERAHRVEPGEQALFVSNRRTRLSVRSAQRLFERVRRQTGTALHVTPHTARHSFVTNELMLGADITVVSRAAGHATIATTMRYRHFLDSELSAAVGLLGVVIPPELAPAPANAATQNNEPGKQQHLDTPMVLKPSSNVTRPANNALDAQENLDDAA